MSCVTSRMTVRACSGSSMWAAGSGAPQCAFAGIPGHTGAQLAGRLVTDGDHEVHTWCLVTRELVPRFAARTVGSDLPIAQVR